MLPESELRSAPRRFKHLGKFVDRISEYQKFDNLVKDAVDARDKFILAFYGPLGIGKSMLLQRLEFECRRRNIANARIVLDQGGDINTPAEIMRQIANQLGKNEFAKWFEIEQFWLSLPDINVQSQPESSINIIGDHVEIHGDIVGGNKIKISNITTRATLNPQGAQNALTETFLQMLSKFSLNKAVVIILDGFDSEEFSQSTRKWLSDNLLDKTRDLEGFGVLPVVALFGEPKFPDPKSPDPSLIDDTYGYELKPLSREHILEYFRIREIPGEIISDVAETCFDQTEGIPSRVFAFVETLLNSSGGE